MEKLVFATNNQHKLEEMREILGQQFQILSLNEIGFCHDIPEDAPTLQGNALQKARYVKEHTGYDCFADDTGLEVDALGGEPGVRSARYAPGEGHDSKANMELLLKNMQGKENRTARFKTVIALILNGKETTLEGVVEGTIATSPRGEDGFGYDPVFIPEGLTRTFAEITPQQKNSISHRGRAARKLAGYLESINKK